MSRSDKKRRTAGGVATGLLVAAAVAVAWAPLAAQTSTPSTTAVLAAADLTELFPAPIRGQSLVNARARIAVPLEEIAQRNRLDLASARSVLADSASWVDQFGRISFADPVPASASSAAAGAAPASGAPLPPEPDIAYVDDPFTLHSKPGAAKVLVLDFTGATLEGTAWNLYFNRPVITTAPFDANGDPSSFDVAERQLIQRVWRQVVDDFAPFDVDVTTEEVSLDRIVRTNESDEQFGAVSIITGGFGDEVGDGNFGGRGYIGIYASDYTNCCRSNWVYGGALSKSSKNIAEAVSHEFGHNLGLFHDGTTQGVEYYGGTAQWDGWAPIMGNSYNAFLSTWSDGSYPLANNLQDDLLVVAANGIPRLADDHQATPAGATALTGRDFGARGVITDRTDVDAFSFEGEAGDVLDLFIGTPNLWPPSAGGGSWFVQQNIDLQATVIGPGGLTVAVLDNRFDPINAPFDPAAWDAAGQVTLTESGRYTVIVDGVASAAINGSYTDYGSLGGYTIDGTLTRTSTTTTASTSTTSTTSPTSTTSTSLTTSSTSTTLNTSSTSTTRPATTRPLPSVPVSGDCRATGDISRFGTGYGMAVYVEDLTGSGLSDWTVDLTLPVGQTVVSSTLGVVLTPTGATITPSQAWQRPGPNQRVYVGWVTVLSNGAQGIATFSCRAPVVPPTTVPTTVPTTISTTVPATTVPVTTLPVTTMPVTTMPATTVPSTTRPPRRGCSVVATTSRYYGGYGQGIQVRNRGAEVLDSWVVIGTLPDGQTFNFGSANISQGDGVVTIRPTEPWQMKIQPGETRSVSWLHITGQGGTPRWRCQVLAANGSVIADSADEAES